MENRDTAASALDILKSAPWFRSLSEPILASFSSSAYIVKLKRGELFMSKGKPAPGIGILVQGAICASTVTQEGQEFTLSMIEFDGIIGLAAVLDGKPSMRNCRAQTDAELLVIPPTAFIAVLDHHPQCYQHFSNALCDRIRTANRIIDELALRPLRERMARLLDTLACNGPRSQHCASYKPIFHTQDDLASLLGVSRHAANRELKRMEQAGILVIGYGSIRITDPLQLSTLIMND